MLEDKTDGYLEEVKELAVKINKLDELEERLDYLRDYSPEETRCLLYKDFAPMSFYFQMQTMNKEDVWQNWFNGGLIFYGPGDTGVGAPQFSVRIGEDLSCGWSIHT